MTDATDDLVAELRLTHCSNEGLHDQAASEITRLRERVADLEAEIDNIKCIEFPARIDKVCADWRNRAERAEDRVKELAVTAQREVDNALKAEAERDAAMGSINALKDQLSRTIDERDALKLQTQVHAQEARTANATISEIYQVCSGATGEPGNWNGAEPVRKLIAERDNALTAHDLCKAAADRYKAERDALRADIERHVAICAEQATEIEGLRVDAERFRWLSFRPRRAMDQWDGVMWHCAAVYDPKEIGLLAAIDAAMKGKL